MRDTGEENNILNIVEQSSLISAQCLGHMKTSKSTFLSYSFLLHILKHFVSFNLYQLSFLKDIIPL